MSPALPLWAEIAVALLLLASAAFTLVAAWGVVRLKDFFERLHPPALVVTWSAWCVSAATILYFSMRSGTLDLRAWVLIILLSITVPITTVVPGTVWCELARDGSALLLHVWHAPDEAAFVAFYKQRYEAPLLKIFES